MQTHEDEGGADVFATQLSQSLSRTLFCPFKQMAYNSVRGPVSLGDFKSRANGVDAALRASEAGCTRT
jgi:hypothetical protein